MDQVYRRNIWLEHGNSVKLSEHGTFIIHNKNITWPVLSLHPTSYTKFQKIKRETGNT